MTHVLMMRVWTYVVGIGTRGNGRWEIAVSQGSSTELLEVDVECSVVTLSKCLLHCQLVLVAT